MENGSENWVWLDFTHYKEVGKQLTMAEVVEEGVFLLEP